MYISLLHVYLNMLQDKIMLHSWINVCTQKIKQVCKLIHTHLMSINCIISHFFIIKKVMLLNNIIHKDAKMQSRCKWLILAATTLIIDSIAITQYHRDQWKQQWEKYRKCIADVNNILTQRLHLFNKMIKMKNDFQKIESNFTIYIQIKYINLNTYLHFRNVSNINSLQCDCEWDH